jgi:hypothetical protein
MAEKDRSSVFETKCKERKLNQSQLISFLIWCSGHKGQKYRYAKFTTTKTRDPFSKVVQMGRFAFYRKSADQDVDASNAKILHASSYEPVKIANVANPGGDNPPNEGPENVLNEELGSKWLDRNKGPLVFDFGAPALIDGFNWATAHDVRAHGRDPVRWRLEGSNDPESGSWDILQEQRGDHQVHKNRMSWAAVNHK